MTEQEIKKVKANLYAWLDMQSSMQSAKLEMLQDDTQAKSILNTEDMSVVEKERKQVSEKLSVLKQLKIQTQNTSKAEELKAIHDSLAKLIGRA